MTRRTVMLAALLVATTLSVGEASAQSRWASWRVFGNTASVEQVGNHNGAAIAQSGEDNVSVVRQTGNRLTATLRQNGDDNRALLRQDGNGSAATFTQNGSGNRMCLAQIGDNLNADVVQNGGDRAGIWVQTESGVHRYRGFGGRVCN